MWEDNLIPLDLILIGKTGVGKSASGNAILQRNLFIASYSSKSETADVKCEWAEHSGYRIKIVDTPGIFYTEMTKQAIDKETAVENMSKAIGMCHFGVHAFLLVIKHDDRDTSETIQTIEILKTIFNENAVKNHCVIVIPRGESLDSDIEDKGLTFEEWCKQQDGERGKLFQECNYRCVLFYNKSTKYESERQQSVQKLLSLVERMAATTGLYTHEQFKKTADVREKMIIEEKAPEMSEEIQMKMSLLSADIEKCSKDTSEIQVGKLLERTQQISHEIDELVAKSKVFQKLQPQIRSIKQNAENLKQIVENKNQGSEEEFIKKFQDELNAMQMTVRATRTPENSQTWGEYFTNCAKTIGTVGATTLAGIVAAPALAATGAVGAAVGATVGGAGVIGAGLTSIASKMKGS